MRQSMRRAMVMVAVLGLTAAMADGARAGMTVNFSYYGTGGPGNGGLSSTGAGSFSFADGLTTVDRGDLASFNLILNENTPNTTTFGLADLSSLSASVGPGPTLTSLSLATDAVQGSNNTTYPREFTVSSLDPALATSYFVILGEPIFWTGGVVTITGVSVPEPSSFTLAILGALIVAGGCARHRNARATA